MNSNVYFFYHYYFFSPFSSHLACDEERVEAAKLLVEHGASIYIENKEEKTPLQIAKGSLGSILRRIVEGWCSDWPVGLVSAQIALSPSYIARVLIPPACPWVVCCDALRRATGGRWDGVLEKSWIVLLPYLFFIWSFETVQIRDLCSALSAAFLTTKTFFKQCLNNKCLLIVFGINVLYVNVHKWLLWSV